MEAEQQIEEQQQGAELEEETGGQEDGQGEAQGQGTESTEATNGANGEQSARPTRRERQAERRGLVTERDKLRNENARLEAQLQALMRGQRETVDGVGKLTETLQRSLPPEKSTVDRIQDEMDEVLPRVGEDPAAYRRYKALQVELTRAVAEETSARYVQKMREEMPAPPSQAEAELTRQYPWVERNRAAREAVNSTIRHLAADGRDMRDPEIREATFLEAGAIIANAWKLPSRGNGRSDGSQHQRFASGSGRGGAPGGGGPVSGYVMTQDDWEMAALAYPNLPKAEQEKRYRATVERELKGRR